MKETFNINSVIESKFNIIFNNLFKDFLLKFDNDNIITTNNLNEFDERSDECEKHLLRKFKILTIDLAKEIYYGPGYFRVLMIHIKNTCEG